MHRIIPSTAQTLLPRVTVRERANSCCPAEEPSRGAFFANLGLALVCTKREWKPLEAKASENHLQGQHLICDSTFPSRQSQIKHQARIQETFTVENNAWYFREKRVKAEHTASIIQNSIRSKHDAGERIASSWACRTEAFFKCGLR